MKYYFEIYLLTDKLSAPDWQSFYNAIVRLSGIKSRFQIIVKSQDNVIRYFVIADHDVGVLSNSIENMVLRPVDKEEIKLPEQTSRMNFTRFVTGGNLLDLKEKYTAKKGKDLHFTVFDVRVLATKTLIRTKMYFQDNLKKWFKSNNTMLKFPAHLLDIDFSSNSHYLPKSIPKYLNIEKSINILNSENLDAIFEVETFPYMPRNYYLNLTSYNFDKHSLIIGASGSGKSKLMGLFVHQLQKLSVSQNYRVVIIDPHDSLREDIEKVPRSGIVNFDNEATELFSESTSDVSAATELTTSLFKTLISPDGDVSPHLERLLRFSLLALFTAQTMSLENLKRFLIDIELRNQILEHIKGHVPENVMKFFGTDFNELRTKYYNEAFTPIVSLVDELQLQPSLATDTDLSIQKAIESNFVTVFSLNKVKMGERVVKTVAGILIQQIFLLAQARSFNEHLVLMIDEVSVVQNPTLSAVLAEARKFNLSVILTQQYFGQINKPIQEAIFSNVMNYYAFKVSEEDARMLEGNLNMEIPKELLEKAKKEGVKEEDLRAKYLIELSPRECLVRVAANGQILPCFRAKTLDFDLEKKEAPETELHEYKTPDTSLPGKFEEKPNSPSPLSAMAATSTKGNTSSPELKPYSAATSEEKASASEKTFNLSQLLASQSSSRRKVNKE